MSKRTKTLLLIVIILGLTSLITSNYSMAKYVSNSFWNYYLSTKGFYFSSDGLDTTKITNINNNWEYDSTYFRIKNSENDFLISDYDIEYTVKCTIQSDASEYSKCTLNGTDSDTFTGVLSSSGVCINEIDEQDVSAYIKEECELGGYKWQAQEAYKDLYFDIIKTGEQDLTYVSVLIEVTSSVPYVKTLIGEFNLSSIETLENGLGLDYKEFANYSRVIMTNSYDENKCVKLSWNPDNLRIDETSGKITSFKTDTNNNINEILFKIDKKNSVSYLFYKTDMNKKYDFSEFSLVESNEC